MTNYLDLKTIQEKEHGELLNKVAFFAFNNEQFRKGLANFPAEQKFVKLGYGGYIAKERVPEYKAMLDRHNRELKLALDDFNFAKSAFLYELGNHEYCYSYTIEPTLDCLGLTTADIESSPTLTNALKEALTEYRAWAADNA